MPWLSSLLDEDIWSDFEAVNTTKCLGNPSVFDFSAKGRADAIRVSPERVAPE
jgi:hypothetical protein